MSNDFTYEYLPLRGIAVETLKFYDVKTKIDGTGRPIAVGFKYPNGSYKVRSLEKKDFWSEGDITKAGLFGRDKFDAAGHKYVTITEGEFDALAIHQVLRNGPVCSVQSSGSAVRDCVADTEWLHQFERIYLAFDNDAAGREAVQRVARLFDYNKIYVVKFDRFKDANEYLEAGETDALRNIWWNAKRYLPETVISSFSEFKSILETPTQLGIPYPWPTLTSMTYGMRRGETVLITAQEGVGKTELMHAIEFQLLKETSHDVGIGAIYLEESKQRHLQALAGLQLKRPVHLPDTNCSVADIQAALEEVVAKDDRLHVYTHFGSDDPGVLLDTSRFMVSARNVHFMCFDHLTMAVSGLAGEDERRALDYLATRLEMMVKELNFGLILVSHVNDLGQTRGSRYIGKVADIRIDAKRNLEAQDPVERNTVYLTVSKNRFCGKTGPAGTLIFDPNTYTLSEPLGFANDNLTAAMVAA